MARADRGRPSVRPREGEPVLLTVKEAAALMRVGRDTGYGLVAAGLIPSVRLGRQIRIPRAALLAHLEREAERQAAETREIEGVE